jgi:radical SAM-linked protein
VDSSATNTSLPAASGPSPPAAPDRVRLRFRKGGDLRLLSHHDLLRCFERLLRRSELPFHRTQGFHPHPRLVFALSLPLGVVGRDEVADLELDEELPVEDILHRLRVQAPPGLDILSACRVSRKSSLQVKALTYRLPLPAGRAEEVRARIDTLLRSPELWLRRSRPHSGDTPLTTQKREAAEADRIDVRPFLRDLRLISADEPGGLVLEIDLWLTPAGTAKPAEVVGLLGLTDWLESGAVLERTRLELHENE